MLAGWAVALAQPGAGLAATLETLAAGPVRGAAVYVLEEGSEWRPVASTRVAPAPSGGGGLEWRFSQVAHLGGTSVMAGGSGGCLLVMAVPAAAPPAVLVVAFDGDEPPAGWPEAAGILGTLTAQHLTGHRSTARVAALEGLLRRQSTSDALTGLPNQVEFGRRLEEILAVAAGADRMVAVGFLDLDRFRTVNDVLGHAAGDKLLQQVAGRLAGRLGPGNVFRMAGDEFVLLRDGLTRGDDHTRAFAAVRAALARPFVCDGHELFVSASMGIALYPYDGEDVGTLVKNADCAMFRAKERGGDTVECYSEGLFEEARRRLSLERSLRRAVAADEIFLEYQPQIDLRTGAMAGVEALARWRHPDLGVLGPATFMPLAEETGLIIPIGERIIEMACAQAGEWAAADPGVRTWVNLSARQFHQGNLTAQIGGALRRSGLPAGCLGVEITESLAMRHPAEAASVLEDLAAIGVTSALDDFGTGYSSLAYLTRFPIDVLKLDRSFVQSAPGDRGDATIARAVIALAHGLGMTVVAEGVETEEQHAFLAGEGCDQAQGFLLGRPRPAEVMAGVVTGRARDLRPRHHVPRSA